MNSHNGISVEEENFIQKVFSKYLPYWPLFLLAFFLAVASAWLYLKFSTPVYEATATLIIKDEKKGSEESKITESLDQISSKKIVENEIEVIQSRKLMQHVAATLDLLTPVSQKEAFKKVSAYYTSPVRVKAISPDSLKTKEDIPMVYNKRTGYVTLDNKHTYKLNTPVKTPYGTLEFVLNEHYDGQSEPSDLLLSVYHPKVIVPGLLSRLEAEPSSKLSSVVVLSYRDEIPERAENVLNQLINSYRQSEIEEKNALAKNTLEFVNERLALVMHDLDTIQQRVQAYKSGQDAVDIGTQGQLYLQNVSENDQKLSQVNTQISVLAQVERFVKNRDQAGGIVPSTLGVSDPMLTELLNKLNTLELEYEKGKATTGENNPRMIEIRDQINQVKPNILANIQSQQRSLTAMRNNISATNSTYNSMLRQVPQKERQLIDISREAQNKHDLYQFLLQKKEESEISYASTVANNKVVDYAEAGESPVAPKKMVVYGGALALFLGGLIGFIMLKDSLNGRIMFRHEIEAKTDIPVIGEVNFDKSQKPIVVQPGKRSIVAEEFRKLRLSLTFMGIDEQHKRILVTSSISGEGKSFIASNLAASLTLTGKKVVLVDMDLNNPAQASIFKAPNEKGVTQFLQGSIKAQDILQKIDGFENFYLIPSGALPEDPTELIFNGRAEKLLNHLDTLFDIIIIDTSPMVLVTDGYMLTNLCDTTLYVVRHEHTPKVLIKRFDANNEINPIHNPAIVFNGVKQRGLIAANYGYGYGYNYVYGNKPAKKGLFARS